MERVEVPTYRIGTQLVLQQCVPKYQTFGLPFEVLQTPAEVGSFDTAYFPSLTSDKIRKLSSLYCNPRYETRQMYSVFVLSVKSDAQFTSGFQGVYDGLVFIDNGGVVYPITHQLIVLLTALSPFVCRKLRKKFKSKLHGGIESTPIRLGNLLPRAILKRILSEYSYSERKQQDVVAENFVNSQDLFLEVNSLRDATLEPISEEIGSMKPQSGVLTDSEADVCAFQGSEPGGTAKATFGSRTFEAGVPGTFVTPREVTDESGMRKEKQVMSKDSGKRILSVRFA